ncbi:MAG: ribonuclease D [Rickettsiaceae bacterium]|nr:MAG: ribonuclease D [Rickettsiaceae bacterium]
MKDSNITFVNQQDSLEQVCQNLAQSRIISIDTEFERSTTYFSKPSIIQIASDGYITIIDVRASLNLTSLKNILSDVQIIKIFHSPREDLEIFFRLFKLLPKNIFDTQAAAKLCGLGASISYSNLCAQICAVKINKEYQRANWLQRPLSIEMLKYAANDVKYLENIYNFLSSMIKNQQLQDRVVQVMDGLTDPQNYKSNLNDIWKKVDFKDPSEALLSRMKIIAAFREECAIETDMPRKHFLSDKDLIEICRSLPTDKKELKNLNLNSIHITKQRYQNKLLDLCIGLKVY